MTNKSAGNGSMHSKKGLHIWTLFGVVVVALICSAVVGTQPVRAAAACTSSQCSTAFNYAQHICLNHCGVGGCHVAGFVCPVSSETDDFGFSCFDGYHEQDDCSTRLPS
jgi:hypothetical protein